MFSRDPSELVRKEKMSDEEISRSIRLALAAELDAINFYLQQSSLIPEGAFKKVHEDIAKEEVTHFGEFMRLLYEYEPDDFKKIKEGWDEASGLLSGNEAAKEGGNFMTGDGKEGESELEKDTGFRHHFGHFRIIQWEGEGVPMPEDEAKIVPLKRLVHQFRVRKGGLDLYREEKVRENFRKVIRQIGEEILLGNDLALSRRAEKMKPGDWSKEGEILGDAIEARNKILQAGYTSEPLVVVSPDVNRLLLRQSEESGQPEIDLIREGVGPVQVSPYLRGDHMIVLHPESFWVFVKKEPELKRISETADETEFTITCEFLPLLYDKKAAVSFDWKK